MLAIQALNTRTTLYPFATALWEIQEGKTYATWDMRSKSLTLVRFSTTWSVMAPHVSHDIPECELFHRFVAQGVQVPKCHDAKCYGHNAVLLDTLGISPYGSGLWSDHTFTVPATPAALAGLDEWLKAHGEEGLGPAITAAVELTRQDEVSPWYEELVTKLAAPFVREASLAS